MKHRILASFLLAVGVASLAAAQTPESKQSASPTSNQYRIRVTEPMEGATVTGTTVNIVIAPPPAVPAGTSVNPAAQRDSMRPTIQIWVDEKDYGNLPSDQNVFTATNLSPGAHTVVIVAKNNAGELIDRKELTFTSVEGMAASAPSTQTETTMTSEPAPPASTVAESAPAPAAPSQPSRASEESERESLPATATAYPTAAVGGLALVALGLALVRRRSR